MQQQMYKIFFLICYLLFLSHNSKLKTEVMIDQKSMLVTELNKNINIQGVFPMPKVLKYAQNFQCVQNFIFSKRNIFFSILR